MNVVEGAKIRRGEEVKLRGDVDSQGDAALQCRRLGNREISTDYDKTGKIKTLIIQAEIESLLLLRKKKDGAAASRLWSGLMPALYY
jgi:hypothetical protein